jgi:hypothetical protein
MSKLPGQIAQAALRAVECLLRGRGRARVLAAALAAATLALAVGFVAAPVFAERSQSQNLVIYLRGGVSPRTLPRDHTRPVAMRLQAGIGTVNSVPLPRVKEIRLELAYRGTLDTYGLPVCGRARLRALDTNHAIAACGDALVGTGKLYARVFVPSQAPFGLHARLLAFNGETKQGRTAIWVLAYSPDPPISFVLPFYVRHQPGPFSTVLVSTVSRDVGPWPHFAHFSVNVSRQYRFRGREHSYLSASCPLPPRFTSGLLSLARATFSITDGPDLDVETVRTCRAVR